ncbi:MAG: cytochrome C oxidase subunit II [Bacteroidetes bacterium MED-G21]|nr:MAG: cytochrome C oxidase subunit II [Bacteroidetes bacterium MED-G21]
MTGILIGLIIAVSLIVLVQLLRVNELISQVKNEDPNLVNDEDNNTQGILAFSIMGVLFLASVLWQFKYWGIHILPPASSIHGATIDTLMRVTLALILFVFFITQPILAWFTLKYRGNSKRKAYYFVHNNKLELAWTIIPSLVLTPLIIYGLNVWNDITNTDTSNSKVIELYAKQFNWTARYSGDDNTLGKANFKLVEGLNELGVNMNDENAGDDIITREVHLVVGEPVLLKMRSQDVIHSAFLPHFRVQMNCVPGMITQFGFTPTQTTAEMKNQEGDDFEFVLLCNKICGAAHYNMKMKVIVESQDDYDAWIYSQKTLKNTLTVK